MGVPFLEARLAGEGRGRQDAEAASAPSAARRGKARLRWRARRPQARPCPPRMRTRPEAKPGPTAQATFSLSTGGSPNSVWSAGSDAISRCTPPPASGTPTNEVSASTTSHAARGGDARERPGQRRAREPPRKLTRAAPLARRPARTWPAPGAGRASCRARAARTRTAGATRATAARTTASVPATRAAARTTEATGAAFLPPRRCRAARATTRGRCRRRRRRWAAAAPAPARRNAKSNTSPRLERHPPVHHDRKREQTERSRRRPQGALPGRDAGMRERHPQKPHRAPTALAHARSGLPNESQAPEAAVSATASGTARCRTGSPARLGSQKKRQGHPREHDAKRRRARAFQNRDGRIGRKRQRHRAADRRKSARPADVAVNDAERMERRRT